MKQSNGWRRWSGSLLHECVNLSSLLCSRAMAEQEPCNRADAFTPIYARIHSIVPHTWVTSLSRCMVYVAASKMLALFSMASQTLILYRGTYSSKLMQIMAISRWHGIPSMPCHAVMWYLGMPLSVHHIIMEMPPWPCKCITTCKGCGGSLGSKCMSISQTHYSPSPSL